MVALRAKHMHDLAVLNGTLKEFEIKCLNCGRLGHQTWQCGDGKNFTSAVICNACGGVGHLSEYLKLAVYIFARQSMGFVVPGGYYMKEPI